MAEVFSPLTESPRRAQPSWALWELGFRPFYLLAALWSVLFIPLWALQLSAVFNQALIRNPSSHAHEMIFGYVLAVIIGFLFTAGRNWSGQPTPSGRSLQFLAMLWLLARVASFTPWLLFSLLLNLSVPWVAAWGLWRSLYAGRNSRNYFFVALLVVMGLASACFHLSQMGWQPLQFELGLHLDRAVPLALDIVLLIVAIMMGRVVPMFSNNGIPGLQATRKPLVEKLSIGSILGLMVIDSLALQNAYVATFLGIACIVHGWRWYLWQPWKTWRNPMVWVLQSAYFWLLIFLALKAFSATGSMTSGHATHALTVGLIGMVTLGMMTRTSLGHTGNPIHATWVERTAFSALFLAASIRVFTPLVWPSLLIESAVLAAVMWSAAFALYLWRYTPLLVFQKR
jgi:uncharacterized protein involved in response to NO